MRTYAAALAIALLALAAPVRAQTDYTDSWWGAGGAESGWGVNLTHQANFIFATFFVYDTAGRAQWYTGQMDRAGSAVPERFTGPMIRTTGTYFGAPVWSGATAVQVGTVTFQATSANTGTLSYTVDGVQVSKSIERLSLRTPSVAGFYSGAVSARRSGCSPSTYDDLVEFDVVHNTSTGEIRIDQYGRGSTSLICRMEGTAVQRGRMLVVDGARYDCPAGWRSTARIFNLRPGANGFEGQYTADAGGGCTESGQFSGVTRFP